jgi:enamine deaminase RidA (YjgF/YER057c/UK114 family)
LVNKNAISILALAISCVANAQPSKPIKRPPNNQLAIEGPDAPTGRSDSPLAIAGVTSQLVFHTSPLSSRGLLSQQVEEALKALDKANGSATFLKLRAFVSGTGDLRRVQGIVSEYLSEKKLPLPIVTTVQVGAVAQGNPQVVIESISEEKKPVNENGLTFFAAKEAESGRAAVTALHASMTTAGTTPLRITCFAYTLTEAEAARDAIQKLMPKAASVSVQTTRYPAGSTAACEAIGQGGPVRNPKLVFTAAQLTPGINEQDVHAAFERLDHAVESFGISHKDAAQLNVYSVDKPGPPDPIVGGIPTSTIWIEGLTSQDARLAIEAIIPAN